MPARSAKKSGQRQINSRDSRSVRACALSGSCLAPICCLLTTLCAVAQRRSLFDDPAEEINEMTAIIKQSISHLSTEVNDLKARSAGTAAANKQAKQHSTSVINSLHSTLKKTTSEFMNVVKARRQVSRNMPHCRWYALLL